MSKYIELKQNPPVIKIVKGSKEVIFTTVSCMCDNIHYLKFRKNGDGEFKMSGNGHSLSNWQMKHPIHEIEWKADEEKWDEVIKMINTGTEVIEKVISR